MRLSHAYRRLVVALLLPALLLAQGIGFAHRIAHTQYSPYYENDGRQTGVTPDTSDSSSGASVKHSCSAFDAATLGACLTTQAALPRLTLASTAPRGDGFDSHTGLILLAFSSRAPPAFQI